MNHVMHERVLVTTQERDKKTQKAHIWVVDLFIVNDKYSSLSLSTLQGINPQSRILGVNSHHPDV